MAIVNTTPTTPTLTLAQRQARFVNTIKARNTFLMKQIISTVQATYNDIWANEDQENFNPQACFTLFGTDGGPLCVNAAALAGLVNAVIPNSLDVSVPAPYTLTTNPDGSVTLVVPSAPST